MFVRRCRYVLELLHVVGFHVIVDGCEGMQVQGSEKVVQAVPETP